ncbi:hypothetical protein FMN50_11530 [Rhodobacterales bacterium]|nr:hypothetical protein FMN50_11530 [Rhodobacterales bacterium]
MSARVNEFARRVYVAARNIGLAEPQARLAAAQASVETGYGKSVKGNNYFGIKAGKSWSGSVQNFRTWEEVNGQKVNVSDKFRKYENLEESLKDWVGTVTRRWPDAMIATTFEDAMRGLRYGRPDGYATDSHYGEKLAYVERRIGESYSPPTDELKNFLRKTEADADLSNLLAGERGVPQQATISDTQGVVDVNILATPVPRHKPGTMPLQAASWDEGERRSDMNLVSVRWCPTEWCNLCG